MIGCSALSPASLWCVRFIGQLVLRRRELMVMVIYLPFPGVFGADKVVQVEEGDSLTLNTGLTELQSNDEIYWRFGEDNSKNLLVEIVRKKVTYDDPLKERLQIDSHTGDLTITNIRIKHSGLYEAQISKDGTTYKTFRVTVTEPPHLTDVDTCEVKSVSVTEGHSVTLHTDVQTHTDDLILWRFGPEGVLLAKGEIENRTTSYNNDDERFRDRLKMNDRTGSLTITNTKKADAGVYKLKISSNNKQTLRKTLSVSIRKPGLSSGDVVGIIFGILLGIVGGVILYRRINYELQKRKVKVMTVSRGDFVNLPISVDELESDDVIELSFRAEVIAKFQNNNKITSDDVRFRDSLMSHYRTEFPTISCIRTEQAGLYKVKISSNSRVKSILQFITGGGPTYYQFNVIVKDRKWKNENGSVTLHTGVTDLQSDDEIQWMFGETLIAEINRKNNKISTHDDVVDGRFKDKLKLNNRSGDLTFRDLNTEHTGEYKLKIISSRGTSDCQFEVSVRERIRSVKLGESVTLETDVDEIQTDDVIQWRFGDEDIAEMTVGSEPSSVCTDERFRNRLKMYHQTGDLTITNFTSDLSGVYGVKISSRRRETQYRKYKVAIYVFTDERESVTLHTDCEIQRDTKIQWISGDKTILVTGKNGDDSETKYTEDERFRGRLKMKNQTGDLTITDIRWTDRGFYTLQQINCDGKIPHRIFRVLVRNWIESVPLGESVTLNTDTGIQTDDEIQWRFRDEEVIAQITVGSEPSYNTTDERFRSRLILNPQTGKLTIRNITPELTGVYRAKISSSGKRSKYNKYKVAIYVNTVRGQSVTLHTDSEIQRGMIEWIYYDETILVTGKIGDIRETKYTEDERFRGRLKMNHDTGDLTITDMRRADNGFYTLQQINSDGKISDRIFHVLIWDNVDSLTELTKWRSARTEENESTVVIPLLNEA